ncbi:MAG: 4Fe-4S dicluster domain-containing protein [Gemmatimonadota bacterium]|nr:MAG: 4Fe-4S dicluster domain-containing protein [Gemmatimonadota bacterium]
MMPDWALAVLDPLAVAVGLGFFMALAYAGLVSAREKEPRAVFVSSLLAVILSAPYLLLGLSDLEGRSGVSVGLLLLTGAAGLALVIPSGKKRITEDDTPRGRIDERDIMFSRNLLEPGTARFEEYYAANPEKRAVDDAFRALPGLLAEGSTMYDPYAYAAAGATEATVEYLRPLVEGGVATEPTVTDPVEIMGFIKGWTLKQGAISVGVTELRDYHTYSTVGRGDDYGRPVELDHDYAIAFTTEMSREMVAGAPKASIVMESYQQYLATGAIAIQLAKLIRGLGYSARAHVDGNYRVVCPLVARDAGLGEIGRMGLLMTPELGPRVRLAVVTTEMPLVADERSLDYTMIDFCARCKKCAEICPAQAIPSGDREMIDGVRRWQIDQEACFTLWCQIGTDCGRCVSVCPYSHPNNLLHNLVRLGVRNSSLFRRLAIKADDLFYGKRPPSAELPDWMRMNPIAEDSSS